VRARAIFTLSVMLLVFAVTSQAATAIPLVTNGPRDLVTIRVGGVVIPDILLDSGFAFDGVIVYNARYLDSLDLSHAVEVRIPGAGGGEPSKGMMIDPSSFMIGDTELANQKIILLTGDAFKGFPSNGVTGYSIFGHYITEIDRDAGVINLYPPEGGPIDSTWTAIPMYFKENKIPWVDVSVVIRDEPPARLSTYIDFAASDVIVLLERPQMKFSLPDDTVAVFIGRGLSGDVYGKAGTISKLIIGPYELTGVKASVAAERVRERQPGADAVLGCGAFTGFNLIFDYFHSKLYLKPNSHFGGYAN
jgi:hypothetical protein